MLNRKSWLLFLMAVGLLLLSWDQWPYRLIGKGYSFLSNPKTVQEIQASGNKMSWYQDQAGSAAVFKEDWGSVIVHDGYPTLVYDKFGIGVTQEQLIVSSSIGLLTDEEREKALIIGFGSGVSVGVAASHMNDVTVYEVRPAMIEMTRAEFSEESRDALEKDNVSIKFQDGIVGVKGSEETYNVIFVNVPSPGFKGAEKIWSIETLEALKSRLKPGGIVNMWLHLGLGLEASSIMHNTINAVFEDCRTFIIGARYFSVSCGEGVSKREFSLLDDYPEFHFKWASEQVDLASLMSALEVTEINEEWRTTSLISTYDKPIFSNKAHYWKHKNHGENLKKFVKAFPPKDQEGMCKYAEDIRAIEHFITYCRHIWYE